MKRNSVMQETPRRTSDSAAGFTLVELMLAMVVLIIGLLGTATLLLSGLMAGLQAEDLAIANQFAKEGIESVFTARITNTIPFSSVYNKSQGGIFRDGYQPINALGPDGLVNTDVYASQPPLEFKDPGKDNIYGTADDKYILYTRFSRQILIQDYPGDNTQRVITVNVQVTSRGITNLVTSMTTVMSPFN